MYLHISSLAPNLALGGSVQTLLKQKNQSDMKTFEQNKVVNVVQIF